MTKLCNDGTSAPVLATALPEPTPEPVVPAAFDEPDEDEELLSDDELLDVDEPVAPARAPSGRFAPSAAPGGEGEL